MRIINASYEVLSDPTERLQHDRWIASVESDPIKSGPSPAPSPPRSPGSAQYSSKPTPPVIEGVGRPWIRVVAVLFLLSAVLGMSVWFSVRGGPAATTQVPVVAPKPTLKSVPLRPRYSRPLVDPYGQPWPLSSSYLTDYNNTGGLSSLTVDNRQNRSDMLVGLFDRSVAPAVAVRVFFLRAYEQFKMKNIRLGTYDIRYRDLDSGVISRSEPFDLQEIRDPDGTQYSVMTLTLYTVYNGNTHSEIIGEDEFLVL